MGLDRHVDEQELVRHLAEREVQRAGERGDLRLVNLDGLDLGQMLITQGLAVDRRPVPMDWCLRAANGARLAFADSDAPRLQ